MLGSVRDPFNGSLIKVSYDPDYRDIPVARISSDPLDDLDPFGYPDSHCCSEHSEGGYCSVCGALLHSDENGEGW